MYGVNHHIDQGIKTFFTKYRRFHGTFAAGELLQIELSHKVPLYNLTLIAIKHCEDAPAKNATAYPEFTEG